jgi:hypothetical protein
MRESSSSPGARFIHVQQASPAGCRSVDDRRRVEIVIPSTRTSPTLKNVRRRLQGTALASAASRQRVQEEVPRLGGPLRAADGFAGHVLDRSSSGGSRDAGTTQSRANLPLSFHTPPAPA